jgi:hypothetical protein
MREQLEKLQIGIERRAELASREIGALHWLKPTCTILKSVEENLYVKMDLMTWFLKL